MSLVFSNSTTRAGIVECIDREVKSNSSSYLIEDKTADINLALDEAITIALQNCGTGQYDDSNHTKYPIITTDLVQGQRDYTFTVDGQSNLILDIYKVLIADSNGVYHEVYPVDVQSQKDTESLSDGQTTQGLVYRYDKTGNGIFLDGIPSYGYTNGVKMYINREGSYFVSSDTTKKAGIDGRIHEYLVVSPAYKYACREGLACKDDLYRRLVVLQDKIEMVYSGKDRDVRKILKKKSFNYR